MKINATVAVPQSLASSGKMNHIWQVGSAVTGDFPAKHGFQPANLNAKGTLQLSSGSSTPVTSGGGVVERTKKKNYSSPSSQLHRKDDTQGIEECVHPQLSLMSQI